MLVTKSLFSYFRKQISVPVRVQGLEQVKLIAVGAFHNLALQEDGALWAWGNNEYGQLGTGDTQPRSQPIPVQGLSGLTLVCFPVSNSWFCICMWLSITIPEVSLIYRLSPPVVPTYSSSFFIIKVSPR